MRIAAITNSRVPSLTANSMQAMKVCDALTELGHEVRMFAPAEVPPSSWDDLAEKYGLRHEFPLQRLPSRRALKRFDFVWYAQAAAEKFGANIVYTWLPQSACIGLWRGNPVLLEMHADVAGHLGAWWLRQFWRARGSKRLLVTTEALKRVLERSTRLHFPDKHVQIAPNAVDLNRFSDLSSPSEARRALKFKDGLTAGFTGHFYKGRGMELLLALAQALPTLNFVWAGGTPEALEIWHAELEAAHVENVTLTGFVDNKRLPLVQAAADILLMPYGRSISASSGQDIAEVINPMKMYEYMAAGRAIVTANLPVIHEVLDETMAVFCEPGDVGGWTHAIKSLLADDRRRDELASNARREVEKHTWLSRAQLALEGLI